MNPATAGYDFSSSFYNRFHNINSWTLSIDFFVQYPNLIGMIPIYNALPRSLHSQDPIEMTASDVQVSGDLQNTDASTWIVNFSSYINTITHT
jgi:hypothetical protein